LIVFAGFARHLLFGGAFCFFAGIRDLVVLLVFRWHPLLVLVY
jgi:hypothetical protein